MNDAGIIDQKKHTVCLCFSKEIEESAFEGVN